MENKELIKEIAQLPIEQQIEAYKCLHPEAYLLKLQIEKKKETFKKSEI